MVGVLRRIANCSATHKPVGETRLIGIPPTKSMSVGTGDALRGLAAEEVF